MLCYATLSANAATQLRSAVQRCDAATQLRIARRHRARARQRQRPAMPSRRDAQRRAHAQPSPTAHARLTSPLSPVCVCYCAQAAALLLRVWLPDAGAADPAAHVRRDLGGPLLLPALQRGRARGRTQAGRATSLRHTVIWAAPLCHSLSLRARCLRRGGSGVRGWLAAAGWLDGWTERCALASQGCARSP